MRTKIFALVFIALFVSVGWVAADEINPVGRAVCGADHGFMVWKDVRGIWHITWKSDGSANKSFAGTVAVKRGKILQHRFHSKNCFQLHRYCRP